MSDRGRYDSAMFWLAFGTAAAVIGLALMTIGVTRTSPRENLLASGWFDGGVGLLVLGVLLLLLALGLFLSRRREASSGTGSATATESTETEAVRGYFAERDKLFKMWERDQRARRRKS
jgi:Zn-dependent protease with chaperone function